LGSVAPLNAPRELGLSILKELFEQTFQVIPCHISRLSGDVEHSKVGYTITRSKNPKVEGVSEIGGSIMRCKWSGLHCGLSVYDTCDQADSWIRTMIYRLHDSLFMNKSELSHFIENHFLTPI
jgi:hypothetical protein